MPSIELCIFALLGSLKALVESTDMGDFIIAVAIPVFFVFIGIEWGISHFKKRRLLRFNDVISNLSCGMINQIAGLFMFGALMWLYEQAYAFYHFFELSSDSPAVFFLALLAVDFAYYAWHRASHRVNWIWAADVVHHQSEDYNLSVALRQAAFTRQSQMFFYLPLALLGIPPGPFLIADLIDTLYQFFIHTQLIPKLGPLEKILNTPSHHRAHHGVNPEYIDKNYGGIFIVFDRIFGTFVEEKAPVVYGIVTPLKSWNPLWANVHVWLDLMQLSCRGHGLWQKLYAFWAPPEWTPVGLKKIPVVNVATNVKWQTSPDKMRVFYAAVQFLFASIILVYMLAYNALLSKVEVFTVGFILVYSCYSIACFLNDKIRIFRIEVMRIAANVLLFLFLAQVHAFPPEISVAMALQSLFSLFFVWGFWGPGGRLEH